MYHGVNSLSYICTLDNKSEEACGCIGHLVVFGTVPARHCVLVLPGVTCFACGSCLTIRSGLACVWCVAVNPLAARASNLQIVLCWVASSCSAAVCRVCYESTERTFHCI